MKDIKKYCIEIAVSLLLLSVFISKSFFNGFSIILVLLSIVKVYKKREIYIKRELVLYTLIPLMGIICNLINSKLDGVKGYFDVERGMIYSLIFLFLNLSLVEYERIKNWIMFGGIFSALYSGVSYITPEFLGIKTYYSEYKRTQKMASFQNPIRWARLLQIMASFSFINLEFVKKRVYKLGFVFLSIYFIWNIVINGQRAAILGALISMTIFFFMYIFSLKKNRVKHIFEIITVVIILGFSITYSNKMIKERVISIFDLNKNISNQVRIDFWKTGIDILKESNYIGVGSGNSLEYFENFIDRQSINYQKKYYKYHEGTAFENNYLNIVIENGLGYLFYFLLVHFLILRGIFIGYLKENCKDKKIKLMIIFSLIIGDRIFMFFYPGTDTYIEFLITFLIFYAYKIKESSELSMKSKEYNNWNFIGNIESGKDMLSLILEKKYEDISILKDDKRSLVKIIKMNGNNYVLKVPREKNNRKWQRIINIFRGSDSFRSFQMMNKLEGLGIESTKAIIAAEKRTPFVVDSLLVMDLLNGEEIHKEYYLKVIEKLGDIHKKGYLHGDSQIQNFMLKDDKIYSIDLRLQKNIYG
ncbi:MAG: O-antigen ligase family protein, partial [Leptotrichiaceae bacterium]|nr:O-antigen ligase family protein [Leptotrichiaceae bacterium]